MDTAREWLERLKEAARVFACETCGTPRGVEVSPHEMFSANWTNAVWCHTCTTYHPIGQHCPKGARNTYTPNPPAHPLVEAVLSSDHDARKKTPMCRGLLDYFPLACAEVARLSMAANEQHNPGEEMHWAREKSTDHADCIVRHLVDRGKLDKDGMRHTAKVAWRALALLQLELEK